MPSYLVKVRKKMDIYAQRRVRNVLSGNYGSVFKGRSMDFDDLREYNYGDDVKDIDWKATARSRTIMIRRYIAIRKHNIMIVADNGNSMAALAPSGESKAEVAAFCAGVIAYVAQKHGDLVGMVYGNKDGNKRYAMKEDTPYIENFLKKYSQSIKVDGAESDINSVFSCSLVDAQAESRPALIAAVFHDHGNSGHGLLLSRMEKIVSGPERNGDQEQNDNIGPPRLFKKIKFPLHHFLRSCRPVSFQYQVCRRWQEDGS